MSMSLQCFLKFNLPTVATALARAGKEMGIQLKVSWTLHSLRARALCFSAYWVICKVSQFLKEIEISGKDRALVGARHRLDGDASSYVYTCTKHNHTDTYTDTTWVFHTKCYIVSGKYLNSLIDAFSTAWIMQRNMKGRLLINNWKRVE